MHSEQRITNPHPWFVQSQITCPSRLVVMILPSFGQPQQVFSKDHFLALSGPSVCKASCLALSSIQQKEPEWFCGRSILNHLCSSYENIIQYVLELTGQGRGSQFDPLNLGVNKAESWLKQKHPWGAVLLLENHC